jgi:hypothetical protein
MHERRSRRGGGKGVTLASVKLNPAAQRWVKRGAVGIRFNKRAFCRSIPSASKPEGTCREIEREFQERFKKFRVEREEKSHTRTVDRISVRGRASFN